jgi:hypothetical protein
MNVNCASLSSGTGKRLGSGLILYAAALLALHANPAAADCGAVTPVTDQASFNSALEQFNAETTSPCVFSISVENNIALTEWQSDFNGATWNGLRPITNQTSGVSLGIEGNTHTVSVNGPNPLNNFRPFAIGAGTTVTINDLTITGGLVDDRNQPGYGYGAGIQNYGNLTLNRSTVEGNTFKGSRGGGIYSAGTLTLNQSTVAGNSADSFPGFSTAGAGIYNDGGVVTIDQSTIAKNYFVGSINTAQGGGIYSRGNGAQVTLTNSTLSDNFQHAIFVAGGDVSLDSVTIKQNGWGLYV